MSIDPHELYFETDDCFRCVICGSILEDGEESMPHGGCKRCEQPDLEKEISC
jgi:hypothetical protein